MATMKRVQFPLCSDASGTIPIGYEI